MQQKPSLSRLKIVALLVFLVLAGGFTKLMMTDIPAPAHPIQKQLDAKDFFEQKQP